MAKFGKVQPNQCCFRSRRTVYSSLLSLCVHYNRTAGILPRCTWPKISTWFIFYLRFARGFQNSIGVRFHIKMIKTEGRSPTKWRQRSVHNAGQGDLNIKKHKKLKLGGGEAYDCSVGSTRLNKARPNQVYKGWIDRSPVYCICHKQLFHSCSHPNTSKTKKLDISGSFQKFCTLYVLFLKMNLFLQNAFTGLQCNLRCALSQRSNVWASLVFLSGRLRCWWVWLVRSPH